MAKYELIADIGTDFVNMSLKNADFVLREPALVLADARNESDFLSADLPPKGQPTRKTRSLSILSPRVASRTKSRRFFSAEGNGKASAVHGVSPKSGRLLSCACRLLGNGEKKVLEEIFNNIGVKSVRFKESVLARRRSLLQGV